MEQFNVNLLKPTNELSKDDNEIECIQDHPCSSSSSTSSQNAMSSKQKSNEVNNSNKGDLIINNLQISNSKLNTISNEDVRRQSSVHSDQTLNVTHHLYPTTSLSHTASAFSSYLRIPSIYEQMNDTVASTHSADWSKSLHRSSCFNTPQSLSEEDQKFTQATVRAVLAASARESRTALTDLPLDFFINHSDIDNKLSSLSVQQLYHRNLSTESAFNVNRLNIPSSKYHDECKERRTNRKFSTLYTHSFDDTIHDSVLLYKRDKSPIPMTSNHSNNLILNSTTNLSNFTQLTRIPSSNKNIIVTTKQNPKSLKNLARQTSHSINRPLKRLAASFRLTKTIDHSASVNYKHHCSRTNMNLKSDHTVSSWNSVTNCIDSIQTTSNTTITTNTTTYNNNSSSNNNGKNIRTRSVILQTDHDFINEFKHEKGLHKGHLLVNDNTNLIDKRIKNELSDSMDYDINSLLSQDDNKPNNSSFHLKEQFFAFFQPTGNKLAMKLFGTKLALDRERLRQEQQGDWIIHPCSNFRFYWDLVMLLLLIANLIILPVAISFFNDDLSIHWIVFNCVSDTVFLIDIGVNFRTGIIKNNFADEIMLNPKEIARQYLKTWFLLDLLSSLPLDYIYLILHDNENFTQFVHAGRALRFLRFVKLLSLIRLLRLSRLVRYVSEWEEFINLASKFIGIFNLVLLLLLLGHWNACLQFLIPMLHDYPVESWVAKGKLQNAYWFDQYTWALFKAMSHMLTIGYGRYPPTSLSEAWVTVISMVTGATGYALFVGHAAALIQSFDCSKRLYREKFKQVDEYMAYRKLPRGLRKRIASYYEHRYQGKMFNENEILNELSECLKEQIINYNCRALVAAVPFFTFADQNFVSEVVVKLRYEVFQPGDLIIKEGTIGTKMYFIQEGIVDIVTRDGEVATSLSDGSYFGEICLLTNARRVASVRAETYCNVYSLDRASFLEVLDNYPLMRRTMESVAAERLNKIGRDPLVVSNRKDLYDDLKLVNEIVNQAIREADDVQIEGETENSADEDGVDGYKTNDNTNTTNGRASGNHKRHHDERNYQPCKKNNKFSHPVNYFKQRKLSHWNPLILRKSSEPEWLHHSANDRSSATSTLFNTGIRKWYHIKHGKSNISKVINKTKSVDNLTMFKLSPNLSNNWHITKSTPVNVTVSVINEHDDDDDDDVTPKESITSNTSIKINKQSDENNLSINNNQ
uniref:Cyclic nucleotide-binding domain-containing protein n=2 Tax=Schistosoma mansoni TaxID=6183 RepID=A0A5K4FAL2_SCHMA